MTVFLIVLIRQSSSGFKWYPTSSRHHVAQNSNPLRSSRRIRHSDTRLPKLVGLGFTVVISKEWNVSHLKCTATRCTGAITIYPPVLVILDDKGEIESLHHMVPLLCILASTRVPSLLKARLILPTNVQMIRSCLEAGRQSFCKKPAWYPSANRVPTIRCCIGQWQRQLYYCI